MLSNNNFTSIEAEVDLDSVDSGSLQVKISDALSERDKVKFTVQTNTGMPEFQKSEFSVLRFHEDFLWLHDVIQENPTYAGFIIPPKPQTPDFYPSQDKLQKLGDSESGVLTKEEYAKVKQELEAEYLAIFKKTVAQHEVFLQRLANHPSMKNDRNFHVFLEFESELNVRGKNKKEKLVGMFSTFQKTGDELLLGNTQKDVDDFFENEKTFLVNYNQQLKEASLKADKATFARKELADNFIKLSASIIKIASVEGPKLESFLSKLSDTLEKVRKIESRLAADEDLKLTDCMKYHCWDTTAAKDLLFRRLRCLANYEKANKELDLARTRNKDVAAAENRQTEACATFEKLSNSARTELAMQKKTRVEHIRSSLGQLVELEIKQGKAHCELLKEAIGELRAI